MNKLKRKLEVLLFITREPLRISKAKELLDVDKRSLLELVDALNRDYDEQESGLCIRQFDQYIQLATNDRYKDFVVDTLNLSDDKGLGQSTFEVLSIIAYKQPVTRAQIDYLRGVSSDYSIKQLVERDLIRICGQLDAIGNPNLYVTTTNFLKVFNLNDIGELPLPEEK